MFFLIYSSKYLANENRWSTMKLFMIMAKKSDHYAKSAQVCNLFLSVFPRIRTKYGNLLVDLGIK